MRRAVLALTTALLVLSDSIFAPPLAGAVQPVALPQAGLVLDAPRTVLVSLRSESPLLVEARERLLTELRIEGYEPSVVTQSLAWSCQPTAPPVDLLLQARALAVVQLDQRQDDQSMFARLCIFRSQDSKLVEAVSPRATRDPHVLSIFALEALHGATQKAPRLMATHALDMTPERPEPKHGMSPSFAVGMGGLWSGPEVGPLVGPVVDAGFHPLRQLRIGVELGAMLLGGSFELSEQQTELHSKLRAGWARLKVVERWAGAVLSPEVGAGAGMLMAWNSTGSDDLTLDTAILGSLEVELGVVIRLSERVSLRPCLGVSALVPELEIRRPDARVLRWGRLLGEARLSVFFGD